MKRETARFEYLTKIAIVYSAMGAFGIAIATGLAVALVGLIGAWFSWPESSKDLIPLGIVRVWGLLLAGGSIVILVGIVGCLRARAVASTFGYVPPVAVQIAALPAEEILVRGSDQSATSSDELLRAAQEGAAEPAKELLQAESRTP